MSKVRPAGKAGAASAEQQRHYAALDGLRGFASLSVVLFHLGHWLHMPGLAANSGLAVDFFFCLSGYVLTLAYERRFDVGMSTTTFLRVRLIRLMPLISLAAIVSFGFLLLRHVVKHEATPLGEALLALGLGLLNLPTFWASKDIGGPQVFPLNGPQYSLFLEIVVNLFWATTRHVRRLEFALLVVAVAFGGVLWLGFGGDETKSFWQGLPRVALSYYLGVVAFYLDRRIEWPLQRQWLFLPAAALMVLAFYCPQNLPFPIKLAWVAGVAPILVLSGAAIELPPAAAWAALLAGELSYPVYALHYPIFCWVNGVYQIATRRQDAVVESLLTVPTIVVCSYAALRFFDRPVRRLLSRKASGEWRST